MKGRSVPVLVAALGLALQALGGPAAESGPEVMRLEAGRAVSVSSAALLMSGMSGGGLAVWPLAVALPSLGAEGRILVLLEVDLTSLPAAVEAPQLEAAVYALTASGEVVATTAVEVDLDSVAAVAGLQIAVGLTLPPGSYTLQTMVRERVSGAIGLAGRMLEVPSADPAGLAAWLLQPGASWIVGVADPAVVEELRAGPQIAAARPVLRSGDVAFARLLRLAGVGDRQRLEARIVSSDGTVLASVPATIAPGEPVGNGLQAHSVSLVVPDLPPGTYGLRLAPAGGVSGRESAEATFVVPVGSTGGMTAEGAPDTEGARVALPRSLRRVAAGYRDLLPSVAAGDFAAAGDRLRALELAIRRGFGSGELRRFIRAEQDLIARIAREAPAALPALLLLHTPLLEQYHAAGAAVLEGYTVTTLERLARSLARRLEVPEDQRAAARALSIAGATLQRTGWHDASARVFASALALDGVNQVALLGAAASREKAEDYSAAVALLRTLVAAEPDAEEGRLRLALNLARIGKPARANEILRTLGGEAETEWISVLAFQELARQERPETPMQAEAVLRQGLARWPEEPGLLLQLAQLLEPEQTADATAALLQPVLRASRRGPSPRYHYNRWPRPPDDERGASAGQRALARWLERSKGTQ
ncbi:MAG: hypothetical protein O7A04_05150 [Acidobacteria bacterium]|nr:hypothetical protein [Acidobacteriota bacterium]